MPEYGTNFRALLPPIDTEQLRATLTREIRRTLNELAPGVDPGIIFDILVDVSVSAHEQVHAQVNVGVIHNVSYIPPMASTSASDTPNWVNNAPAREDRFRQEYAAEFLPSNPDTFDEFSRLHDDTVDSMRTAIMGIDPGIGRDETAVTVAQHNPNNPTPWSMRGFPTGRLDVLMGRSRPRQPPNPVIDAVVKAKLKKCAWPGCKEPNGGRIEGGRLLRDPYCCGDHARNHMAEGAAPKVYERLTVWERIRKNYALFE